MDAYYAAKVAEEQIEVFRRVLNLSGDRIEYQQLRREYGQGGTFDELQVRDAYLRDSTSLVVQRTTYANNLRQLFLLMGTEEVDRDVVLTDSLTFAFDELAYEALLTRLIDENSQLQSLRTNRELARLNTELIETERKPTIGVGAGAAYDISVQQGTQTFDFGGDAPQREQELPGVAARTLTGNIGLTANYLLYDGGNRSVRIQTAKLQQITADLNYQNNRRQLETTLANTLALYRNQRELYGITRALIDNAERNLGIAEERFRGGTINSFDYRLIQVNYINAESQLLTALQNLKATETEILRLTGGILR